MLLFDELINTMLIPLNEEDQDRVESGLTAAEMKIQAATLLYQTFMVSKDKGDLRMVNEQLKNLVEEMQVLCAYIDKISTVPKSIE